MKKRILALTIAIMVCFSFLCIGANATPVLDEDGTVLVGDNGAGLVALVEELPGDVVTVSVQLKGIVNITTIQSVIKYDDTKVLPYDRVAAACNASTTDVMATKALLTPYVELSPLLTADWAWTGNRLDNRSVQTNKFMVVSFSADADKKISIADGVTSTIYKLYFKKVESGAVLNNGTFTFSKVTAPNALSRFGLNFTYCSQQLGGSGTIDGARFTMVYPNGMETLPPTASPTPSPTPIATDPPTPTPSPTPIPVLVTSVKLSKTSATLNISQTLQLTSSISPTIATNKSVAWTTSNSKVVTVSSAGKVTAKGKGTATITVTTKSEGKTAICKISVVQLVTSVKLNKTSVTITKGKTYKLTATVNPSSASNKKVTWKSSSTKIATVSSLGIIKGIKKGTAYIYVYTVDGKKSGKCKVTIK